MDDAIALNNKAPAVRIGIRGLTHTKSMLGGGIYLLIAETTSARFPMLAGSVAGAFEDRLVCTLIVPGNTAQFIQRIERLARINTAELVAENRLQIFMTQDNFLKKMFQFGAERFVDELADFGIPENSYLIFDQADELLSLHDISLAQEQINVLKEWFAKRGITALLVFSRFTDAHNNTVNAIMDNLGGIVRLGGAREGLELKFDYWQSPTAVIAAKNYQLETLDTGLYKATSKAIAPDPLTDDDVEEEALPARQMLAYEAGTQYPVKSVIAHSEKYRGYLKPPAFMQEVGRTLDQLSGSNMSSALVVATPSSRMGLGDVVKRFDRSSRLGEVITADDRQCYMYLNVDTKSAALESLEIVLGRSIDTIFSQYRLLISIDEIRLELAALSYAIQLRSFPDFSPVDEVPAQQNVSNFSQSNDRKTLSRPIKKWVPSPSPVIEKNKPTTLPAISVDTDFELAKRSVSLQPNFPNKNISSGDGGVKAISDGTDEILFDVDIEIEGPIFEKSEAPRAKRSLS